MYLRNIKFIYRLGVFAYGSELSDVVCLGYSSRHLLSNMFN